MSGEVLELIAVLLMLVAGVSIALIVIAAKAWSSEDEVPELSNVPRHDTIVASLLFQVARAGVESDSEALRQVRRFSGLASPPVTTGIDVSSWAQAYASSAAPRQRASLLETAVQLVANRGSVVPVNQYAALLDLSFGLGFQTDALARLREAYQFEYVDPAKAGRPREADRLALVPSRERTAAELLKILEITGEPTRQSISASYRRLVAVHHPDRFHEAPEEARSNAAARFIEITEAYEALIATYRD